MGTLGGYFFFLPDGKQWNTFERIKSIFSSDQSWRIRENTYKSALGSVSGLKKSAIMKETLT